MALAALEWLARLVFGRRKHIALSLHRRHETERFYVLKFEGFQILISSIVIVPTSCVLHRVRQKV